MSGKNETDAPARYESEPGLPALIKRLNDFWRLEKWGRKADDCDILDDPRSMLTTLAIPLDKAHELWDYGRTVTPLEITNMPVIKPHDGWQINDSHGYMAYNDHHTGRLIALSDLVNWIIEEKQQPCGVAVSRLCHEIQNDINGGWLYVVQAGDFAKHLKDDYCFAYLPMFVLDSTPIQPGPQACGVPGLLAHIHKFWGSAARPGSENFMGQHVLDPIAIPIQKAHELFDYGQIAGDQSIDSPLASDVPRRVSGSAWSDEQHACLLTQYEATPGKTELARRKALGLQWGMKVDNVKKQVDIAKKKAKEKAEKERLSRAFPSQVTWKR